MKIHDAKDVPDAYKVAFYDALAAHFADTIDNYYTRDVEPDPRYDSGVEPAERTEAVLMELGTDKDVGDLFVVMEVEGWVDFLGFRVELPTLTRDAMEWEGGGPEIDDRFASNAALQTACDAFVQALVAYFNKRGAEHALRKGNEDIAALADALADYGTLASEESHAIQ